jgi:putative ABC transport system permease protein
MIFADTTRLALRNLREAKARTILTTLGVAIGIGALTAMMSLGVGLQEQVVGSFMKSGLFDTISVTASAPPGMGGRARRRAEPVGKQDPATRERPRVQLDDDALKQFAAMPRVREVFPNVRIPVQVRFGDAAEFATALGVPMSARGEGVYRKITYGGFFASDSEDVCMLNLDLARRLVEAAPESLVGREVVLGYASPGAGAPLETSLPIPGLSLQRVERKFRIVGIVEREQGPMGALGFLTGVLLPLRLAQQMAAIDLSDPQALLRQLSDRRTHSSATVRVKHPKDTDEVERKIKDLGFSAFSINDALQGAKNAFLMLDLLLGLTGSVALMVALLGIANTMVMSILERTREIGIMKAIGGSDADVRSVFLVEASLIGLVGGLFGVLLGWAVARVINFGANLYIQSQGGVPGNIFSFPWWLLLGAVVFAVLTSLIAGSIPASRAARLDPIQALRHD